MEIPKVLFRRRQRLQVTIRQTMHVELRRRCMQRHNMSSRLAWDNIGTRIQQTKKRDGQTNGKRKKTAKFEICANPELL